MIIFPGMLISAAKQAGMNVPENPEDFDPNTFPHFAVFCNVQLGRPITWGEHWENAKIVAAVPNENIKEITLDNLIKLGLQYQT